MPVQSSFHAPAGRDFLGFRKAPSGAVEIVYDDGAAQHLIWRVAPGASEGAIGDALSRAVGQARVLPALFDELRKRAIAIEAVTR